MKNKWNLLNFWKKILYIHEHACNSFTNVYTLCTESTSSFVRGNNISNFLWHKVIANTFLSSVLSTYFALNKFVIKNYEIKYVLYIPEVQKQFFKYLSSFATKRLKLKLSGFFDQIVQSMKWIQSKIYHWLFEPLHIKITFATWAIYLHIKIKVLFLNVHPQDQRSR